MMKKLVGNIVSIAMEVLMWITFVVCALGGMSLGFKSAEGVYSLFGAVGGLLLGAVVGMIFNIGWWSLSTFQEIRNYLKEIAEKG
ncbi:MAG: hypothetical protein LBH25_11440 [Fibromonadaceae bacterium]|jgi:hypothetical protein|nr:hypothetical protein [Fibromonadaceae bacterium]